MIEVKKNWRFDASDLTKARQFFSDFNPRLAILTGAFCIANAAQFVGLPMKAIAAPNNEIVVVNSFSPTSADPGVAVDYTIFLQNDNPIIDATITSFTHTLPQGPDSPGVLVFDSATVDSASDNCDFASFITVTLGSNSGPTPGSFSFAPGAVIPANTECQLTFRVKGFSGGPHIATIPELALVTDQGENAQPTSATLSVSPSTTIENLQTNTETGDDLTNVSYTDNLPTDLLIANPSNASTDCLNGTLVANPGGNTVTLTGATLSPLESCEILVDVTSTIVGTYVNQIAQGDVTALIQASLGGTMIENFETPQDTLIVTENIGLSNLLLVKRITAMNGATQNPNDSTDLNGFIDENSSTDDDAPNWPLDYIRGAVNGGGVSEDDVVEYTIYFRNSGERDAASVRVCDRLQPYQTIVLGAFDAGADFELQISDGSVIPLTATNDAVDRAQFLAPGVAIPSDCNISEPNTNGVVVVDITGTIGSPNLSLLPGLGQDPDESYGLLRLRTQITPE